MPCCVVLAAGHVAVLCAAAGHLGAPVAVLVWCTNIHHTRHPGGEGQCQLWGGHQLRPLPRWVCGIRSGEGFSSFRVRCWVEQTVSVNIKPVLWQTCWCVPDLAPAWAKPTNPLPAGVMSFPVFEAASRRTVENWARAPDSSSSNSSGGTAAGELPPELSGYSPDQVKLICLSQVGVCRGTQPPMQACLPHCCIHKVTHRAVQLPSTSLFQKADACPWPARP